MDRYVVEVEGVVLGSNQDQATLRIERQRHRFESQILNLSPGSKATEAHIEVASNRFCAYRHEQRERRHQHRDSSCRSIHGPPTFLPLTGTACTQLARR